MPVDHGWPLWRLEQLATIKRGASPRPIHDPRWFSETGFGWVRIADVTRSERILRKTTQYLSDAGRSASVEIHPGDLIMSICATIGRPLFSGINACIHDGFVAFKDIRRDLVEPEYLLYLLKLKERHFDALSQPGTQKNLNSKLVGKTEVRLPPLDEQRRIVEVLSSVDDAISANRRVLEQIQRARHAVLFAVFEESDFESVPLEGLGSWRSGATPSKADPSNWGGDVQWFCPRDIKAPVVSRSKESLARKALAGSCRLAPAGTLLLVVRGMILAKAIPAAMMVTEGAFNQDIKAFQPNGRALPGFVQLCLQHQEPSILKGVDTASHGTKKLDADTLRAIPIPLPGLAEQKAIVEVIATLDQTTVLCGAEYLKLSQVRDGLLADLLSGAVRTPDQSVQVASAVQKSRPVQPAFKRAAFAAEIVHQLHTEARFGSVKHEKIVHLCELHIGLQDDLDRHAYKEAAGPYDPKARRSVETIFRQQKWFDAKKTDGRIVYEPLEKCGGHASYFDRYFGDRRGEVQAVIDLLRPMKTEQCEIVATLYAVWNDFLIDGKQPSDDEIVQSVLTDWHPSKQQIAKDRWLVALPWMRDHGLIPKGQGEKTRVAGG